MAEGLGTFGLGTQMLGRAIKEPMFKLNNSGFNPTSGPYGFTPTVGLPGAAVSPSKSLAKPQVAPAVVQPALKNPVVKPAAPTLRGTTKGGSKGGSKGGGTTTATTLAGSAPDYDALDAAQTAQDMKLGYASPSAVVPQAANTTAVVPSLANPAMADLYTGSDFSKLSPDQQAAFASSGGTIGDTGNMIPGQGAQSNWDMGDIAKGVEAASGLANAYLGYKNYGLAKDQFGFTKAMANRNIANQASEYNTGLQNAGEVGMSLAGNTMDPNARAARQAQLDAQKISGAPIG